MWRLEDAGMPPRAGVPLEWSTKVWCTTATWDGVDVPAMGAGGVGVPPARRSRLGPGRRPSGGIHRNLLGLPVVGGVADGVEFCAATGCAPTTPEMATATLKTAAARRRLTRGLPVRARRRRPPIRGVRPRGHGAAPPPRRRPG